MVTGKEEKELRREDETNIELFILWRQHPQSQTESLQ